MSIQILEIKTESCPAARFIGRRYLDYPHWNEWWENGWFTVLEAMPGLPINDDGYIGAVRTVDGKPEYWIGMFFPENTTVPAGFESVDLESVGYAVCYLYGKENAPELYSQDTHDLCLNALKARGLNAKENAWCFERYNCPRFTTPDKQGNVILDYAVSIA